MLTGARLHLDADVDEDGTNESGTFDLSKGIEISPGIRTGDLIGQAGSAAASVIDYISGSEDGRAGFNLDAGGGAKVAEINFSSFEGSDGQWGDGSDNAAADASGEAVFRQMSVLFRYLDRGTFDSRGPAVLEWGEFSESGEFTPLQVSPEEPTVSFAAEEESSVFDGSITLVSTRDISELTSLWQEQDNR